MGAAFSAAVAALNRAGLGPLRADVSRRELRRAALRRSQQVLDRLEVPADARDLRAHPPRRSAAGRRSRASGGRLLNTGSWVHEPAFARATSRRESPYRARIRGDRRRRRSATARQPARLRNRLRRFREIGWRRFRENRPGGDSRDGTELAAPIPCQGAILVIDPGVLAFVRESLPPVPARVLEVGAGDGELAAALRSDGYDVVAIDPASSTDSVRAESLHELSEPAGSFDAAVAVVSMHHVEPLRRSCRLLAEVVRPGRNARPGRDRRRALRRLGRALVAREPPAPPGARRPRTAGTGLGRGFFASPLP